MTDNPDLDRIKPILAPYSEVDPSAMVSSTTFEDLGLDSLEVVQVLIELEDKFEVELVDETIDMFTLGEIAGVLATQLEKKDG